MYSRAHFGEEYENKPKKKQKKTWKKTQPTTGQSKWNVCLIVFTRFFVCHILNVFVFWILSFRILTLSLSLSKSHTHTHTRTKITRSGNQRQLTICKTVLVEKENTEQFKKHSLAMGRAICIHQMYDLNEFEVCSVQCGCSNVCILDLNYVLCVAMPSYPIPKTICTMMAMVIVSFL